MISPICYVAGRRYQCACAFPQAIVSVVIAHSSFRYDYLATGLLSHVAMPQPLKTAELLFSYERCIPKSNDSVRIALFAAVAPEILAHECVGNLVRVNQCE